MKKIAVLIIPLLLGACAHISVMQMTANTAEITVDAAPVCGDTGAQNIASQDAAITTLRAGFDRFVIGYNAPSDEFAGTISSGGAAINGSYITGASTTAALFHHEDRIFVTMFHTADPGAAQAIDARQALGPNWAQKVKSGAPGVC